MNTDNFSVASDKLGCIFHDFEQAETSTTRRLVAPASDWASAAGWFGKWAATSKSRAK